MPPSEATHPQPTSGWLVAVASRVPNVDRASTLVQETMDQFDAPGMTVAALTRRCQRIASLRGDGVALAWLRLESMDIQNAHENKTDATRESLAARLLKTIPGDEADAKWSAGYHSYIARRRLQPDKEEANFRSVQQTEELVQVLRDQESAMPVQPPPGMHTYDLGKLVFEQQETRTRLVSTRLPLESILARIKDRLWEFHGSS